MPFTRYVSLQVELTLFGPFFAVTIDPGTEREILLTEGFALGSLGQIWLQFKINHSGVEAHSNVRYTQDSD
jgi:hypothetical protein